MNKPASAPDEVPPRPPVDQEEPVPEGTNETIRRPDDRAEEHPAREDHKPRSPYVTGNT